MDVGAPQAAIADPGAQRRYNSWLAIAAMIVLGNPGATSMTAAPAFLSAFASDRTVTTAQASTLGAANLAGMALALVATSFWIGKVDRRLLAGVAIILGVGGALQCALVGAYPLLLVGQAVAGFGAGLGFTVAVGSLAGTAAPERNFGISTVANQMATAALLAVFARLGLSHGHGRVMLVLAGYVLLMGLLIPALPAGVPDAKRPAATGAGHRVSLGLLGLASTFLLMCGVGGVWPFWGQIAQAHQASPSIVANALTLSAGGATAGGLAAAFLGARIGRTAPLALGGVGLIACMALTLYAASPAALAVSAVGFMFCWIATVPYFLGLQSSLDPTGRFAVLSGACMPLGIATGQFLTGAQGGRSFDVTTVTAMVAVAAAVGVMLTIDRLGRRRA